MYMLDLHLFCIAFLHYDEVSGCFTWLESRGTAKRGDFAGTFSRGYIRIKLLGKMYMAHRIAFLMKEGRMPEQVDHIDGDKSNNRWINLREVSHTVNQQNIRKAKRNNKSGLLGCHTAKPGLYEARIRFCGQQHKLGYFKNPADAHQAYIDAKRIFHEGNML